MTPIDPRELTPGLLRPLVGQRFQLTAAGAGSQLTLELIGLQPLPPHRYRAEPFSLLFRGPREPGLPQRIYSLSHPELGQVDLFLVRVQAPEVDGAAYEAVCN